MIRLQNYWIIPLNELGNESALSSAIVVGAIVSNESFQAVNGDMLASANNIAIK